MEKITFYTRNVYGVDKFYVAEEGQAQYITTLTHRKTIDRKDLEALEALGHEIVEAIAPRVKEIRYCTSCGYVEPQTGVNCEKCNAVLVCR